VLDQIASNRGRERPAECSIHRERATRAAYAACSVRRAAVTQRCVRVAQAGGRNSASCQPQASRGILGGSSNSVGRTGHANTRVVPMAG
jgi:hypothetical protein